MKQHITLKQWEELNLKQKKILVGGIFGIRKGFASEEKYLKVVLQEYNPNIGQMIEFLGEDLADMLHRYDIGKWHVGVNFIEDKLEWIEERELCDTLWEAVKYKLNN